MTTIRALPPPQGVVNEDLVKALETFLKEAKEGNINQMIGVFGSKTGSYATFHYSDEHFDCMQSGGYLESLKHMLLHNAAWAYFGDDDEETEEDE